MSRSSLSSGIGIGGWASGEVLRSVDESDAEEDTTNQMPNAESACENNDLNNGKQQRGREDSRRARHARTHLLTNIRCRQEMQLK